MQTVEIEREKLDRLIRTALAVESEGLQPPDHVWRRILHRVDDSNREPVFQKAVRAEQPMMPVPGV